METVALHGMAVVPHNAVRCTVSIRASTHRAVRQHHLAPRPRVAVLPTLRRLQAVSRPRGPHLVVPARAILEPPTRKVEPAPETLTPAGDGWDKFLTQSPSSADSNNSDGSPLPSGRCEVVPDVWKTAAAQVGDRVALFDPHQPQQPSLTFSELHEAISVFAEGLSVLGLEQGECAALFSENSHRWLVADQGIMSLGACNAVRGTKSSASELVYIMQASDSVALVVETEELLQELLPQLKEANVRFAIVLWPSEPEVSLAAKYASHASISVYGFEEVLGIGRTSKRAHAGSSAAARQPADIRAEDVATLVFTSGTTGQPKAVMLTHANLMHQIRNFGAVLAPDGGDVYLSLLPPWHMYERSCEYFVLSHGAQLVYSGVKTFKEDLVAYPPDFFVAVPLVFEVLYNGVQRKIASASAARAAVAQRLMSASLMYMDAVRAWRGLALDQARADQGSPVAAVAKWLVAGALSLLLLPLHVLACKLVYSKVTAAVPIKKAAISGGGSLPPHVDKFFEAVGISLLNGYGLTETAPVITVRRRERNVLGSVGPPIGETQVKVVDPETGAQLPHGQRGLVKARGPQVMKGYYKNPAATAAVIDEGGWFSTGDLGWIAPARGVGPARNCGGQLVLDGRAKDTIVLANGENVEPTFVEEAALQSPIILQIIVVGQDQRKLGALIVPQEEELEARLAALSPPSATATAPMTSEERSRLIDRIVRSEVSRCLQAAGCGPNERIGSFILLDEPFSVENGLLTATMKMKRDVICHKYQQQHDALFRS